MSVLRVEYVGTEAESWHIRKLYPQVLVSYFFKMGRCQSGQSDQTVNLTAYAYGGSNPSLPTRKASVGDNKSLVRCNLFEEGAGSSRAITSKRLVFNREHFSNLNKKQMN